MEMPTKRKQERFRELSLEEQSRLKKEQEERGSRKRKRTNYFVRRGVSDDDKFTEHVDRERQKAIQDSLLFVDSSKHPLELGRR